jgi:hypothetical protein
MHRATRPRIFSRYFALGGLAFASLTALGAWGVVQAQDGKQATMAAIAAQPLVALKPQPAGVAFPTTAWVKGAAPATVEPIIKAQFDKAFGGQIKEIGETRAVIIVHNGRIVAERYGTGFDQSSKLISWSMAKSVTAALVGIAVADGKMKLDPCGMMVTPDVQSPSAKRYTWPMACGGARMAMMIPFKMMLPKCCLDQGAKTSWLMLPTALPSSRLDKSGAILRVQPI